MTQVSDFLLVEYDIPKREIEKVSFPNDDREIGSLLNFSSPDPENIASALYELAGFEVRHLDPATSPFETMSHRGEDLNGLLATLEEELESQEISSFRGSRLWALDRAGLPDLLVHQSGNESLDYKFVEVKATKSVGSSQSDDDLRHSQLDWMTRFDFLPVKVAYLFHSDEWMGATGWY